MQSVVESSKRKKISSLQVRHDWLIELDRVKVDQLTAAILKNNQENAPDIFSSIFWQQQ